MACRVTVVKNVGVLIGGTTDTDLGALPDFREHLGRRIGEIELGPVAGSEQHGTFATDRYQLGGHLAHLPLRPSQALPDLDRSGAMVESHQD